MTVSPLNLHTFATCESGAGSFVVRLGFDTLAQAHTAHQFVVDSARAKPDAVPAWFDVKALEVAKRFTQDTEPQRRASLQVAVVEAMEMAAPHNQPEPWPPMGVCWAISDVRAQYRGRMDAQHALDLLEVRIMNAKPKASALDPSKAATPALAFAARVAEVFKQAHGEAPADTVSAIQLAAAEAFRELPTASPTPPAAPGRITVKAPQLRQALEFVNPDAGDIDQQEDDLSIGWFPERIADGDVHPAGLYAWFTDLPDEGSVYLDAAPAAAGDEAKPMTDEQIDAIASDNSLDTIHAVARAIERHHGIVASAEAGKVSG